jgi:hypothetical protein
VVSTFADKSPGSIGAAHAEMIIELKKAYQTGFVPRQNETCKDFLARVGEEIGAGGNPLERARNLWGAVIGNERLDAFPGARAHAAELLAGKNPTGIDSTLFASMRTRIEKIVRISGILPDDQRESVDEYARRALRSLLAKNPLLSLRSLDLMPESNGVGHEASTSYGSEVTHVANATPDSSFNPGGGVAAGITAFMLANRKKQNDN